MMNVSLTIHAAWLFVLTFPVLGLFLQSVLFRTNRREGPKIASFMMWGGFFFTVLFWSMGIPFQQQTSVAGFRPDLLTWVMTALILFVSSTVHTFSLNYMAGSRFYRRYFLKLSGVTASVLLMTGAQNPWLFLLFWWTSNALLILLMVHQPKWEQAKNSGILAAKTLGFATCFLAAAQLFKNQKDLSTIFLILAAMAQSGIWPFHRWLISSLNSPTPVSALMHAGLVNGGGFLLARNASIFFDQPSAFFFLFIIGSFTLVLGTLYKMVQSDAKRMLACSTMGQMGFMVMQCGLGLFPAAVAHLCWHGLYKACLFLGIGSAVKFKEGKALSPVPLAKAFLCGMFGAYSFALMSGKELTAGNTETVLIFFAWIAAMNLSVHLLRQVQLLAAVVIASILGALYGGSVMVIEAVLSPLMISMPLPLHPLHYAMMGAVFIGWLYLNFAKVDDRLYLKLLDNSQPHPSTVTALRTGYQY